MAISFDFDNIHRVLITKLGHHRDVLLTSPLFKVLKTRYPKLQADALVFDGTEEMLTLHPSVNQVYTVENNTGLLSKMSNFAQGKRLIKQLKKQQYDLLIHLTDHDLGAYLKKQLKPSLAITAISPKCKNKTWLKSFQFHYPLPTTPRHDVEKNLDALRALGMVIEPDERKLILVPGEEAANHVDHILNDLNLDSTPFLHIHPTSSYEFRCWSEPKMAALINRLHRDGHKVVLTAAPTKKEKAMMARIFNELEKPAIDLTGKLTLKQVAALTARASCFIGVDSAPTHIAEAVQTPTVALYGPSNEKVRGPRSPHSIIVTSDHSCRPCGLSGCAGSNTSDCLINLSVKNVEMAIRSATLNSR